MRESRRFHAWRTGHKGKIWHDHYWSALLHAVRINFKARHNNEEKRRPYVCQWMDDYREGETCEPHWHIGREAKDDMWGY